MSLPPPDQAAVQHSRRVLSELRQRARQAPLSFADYMQFVLNEPGLGYYSVGNKKFGAAGDFVTAPEISDLFAQCVARQCRQYLASQPQACILEVGAGSGKLASDLLQALSQLNCLPQAYYILEPSAELQQRQQQLLRQTHPNLSTPVQWLSDLPENFNGVLIANEVLDAMPVERLRFHQGRYQQAFVAVADEAPNSNPGAELSQYFQDADPELQALMQQRCPSPVEGYLTELAPAREAWLNTLASKLSKALILLIDYGYARHEYYHPQRHMGSLTCHYRHRVHSDPFFYPGIQDITAHVEFTAIAEAASDAGLAIAGFASQAQFLLSCGLDHIVQERMQQLEQADENTAQMARLRLSQEMKQLILPGEMGESFKVLALSKEFSEDLLGFSQFDMRHKL